MDGLVLVQNSHDWGYTGMFLCHRGVHCRIWAPVSIRKSINFFPTGTKSPAGLLWGNQNQMPQSLREPLGLFIHHQNIPSFYHMRVPVLLIYFGLGQPFFPNIHSSLQVRTSPAPPPVVVACLLLGYLASGNQYCCQKRWLLFSHLSCFCCSSLLNALKATSTD